MERTAQRSQSVARVGGDFFAFPTEPNHRRYEALRAYLFDGDSAVDVAARFGYTVAAVTSMARDFRSGQRDFFLTPKPGPKSAPAKDAARTRIIELRQAGHSAYEISAQLAAEGTPLNRTGVAEVLAVEGFPPLQPRPSPNADYPDVTPRPAPV
jgi:transposase